MLGAHHAAVVATWASIMDVHVAYAVVSKETPDAVLELTAVHHLRANHHGSRVVRANG